MSRQLRKRYSRYVIFATSNEPSSDPSQRYSPDLQKKALARREQTQQDFENFTRQLREASKSDKPSKSHYRRWPNELWITSLTTTVWIAQKEIDAKRSAGEQQAKREERDAYAAESRRRQAEIRASTQ
jgi:hypothetical protein